MKNDLLRKTSTLLIVLFSFAFITMSAPEKTRAQTTTIYVKIGVDGMACPFCAYGIEKKIKKIDGAKDLYIDINEGYITFAISSDKKPTEEALNKIVKEAGFKVRKIEYSLRSEEHTSELQSH